MDDLKDKRWKQRFENFEKAYNQFASAVAQAGHLNDLEKEGLVQRFEYTFELAWKTLKDYMESKGVVTKFPRDTIKEAFKHGLIEDGDLWMDMLESRNLATHTYEESKFRELFSRISSLYAPPLEAVYTLLKNTA